MDTRANISPFGRLVALLQLLLIYAFVFNPWVPFPYTFVVIVAAILLLVWFESRSLAGLGFRSNLSVTQVIGYALLAFAVVEPVFDFIVQPLINKITGEITDYSMFKVLEGDFALYGKYLLFVWVSAAIGEEVLFRGFMFRQFGLLIPEHRYKLAGIVVLSAVLFSLPHIYQGVSGLAVTFVFGLIFGVVYIKTGFNLWVTMLFHGLVDTLFLTLAYTGHLGYYELGNKYLFGY